MSTHLEIKNYTNRRYECLQVVQCVLRQQSKLRGICKSPEAYQMAVLAL